MTTATKTLEEMTIDELKAHDANLRRWIVELKTAFHVTALLAESNEVRAILADRIAL